MYVSLTFTALRVLKVFQIVLVPEYVLIVLPDKFDHDLELEVAADALQRKVSFLDLRSGFSDHVVVVVLYATPEFVCYISLIDHNFSRLNAGNLLHTF